MFDLEITSRVFKTQDLFLMERSSYFIEARFVFDLMRLFELVVVV